MGEDSQLLKVSQGGTYMDSENDSLMQASLR